MQTAVYAVWLCFTRIGAHTAHTAVSLTMNPRSSKHVGDIYLNINQLDALNFYNEFISCLYMFRGHVLIVSRSKLDYTASGIIKPVGGRPVHGTATYRCDDTRDCIIQF